jgi:hypothetical protein
MHPDTPGTIRIMNGLERDLRLAKSIGMKRIIRTCIDRLENYITMSGDEVGQCPACGDWDTVSHAGLLPNGEPSAGLPEEFYTCVRDPVIRLGQGAYVRDYHAEDFIEDALDARPSLAAMSRIADQRIDAKALDRLARDVGVGS